MIDQKGQEIRKHGNIELPLGIYDVCLGANEMSITAHWHKEMEIILVTQGMFQLQINGQTYTCKKDDLIFINPEELHYFKAIEGIFATWETLVFDVGQLHAMLPDGATLYFIKPLIEQNTKIFTLIEPDIVPYNELYYDFTKLLMFYKNQPYGFELLIKGMLFSILGTLYRYKCIKKQELSVVSTQQIEKVKEVIDYIACHYNEPITISQLAELCHYNTSYFMRFFKKHTGKTCTQFIKIYRLEKATQLLQTTDKSITQVALDVGFVNISYFVRSFKEYYHVTPKAYLKEKV